MGEIYKNEGPNQWSLAAGRGDVQQRKRMMCAHNGMGFEVIVAPGMLVLTGGADIEVTACS
jgi:hypothetical protein